MKVVQSTMRWFANLSIKRKLTFLYLFGSLSVLLFSLVIFAPAEYWLYKNLITKELGTMSRVVGFSSRAALAFGDSRAASRMLNAVGADERIIDAVLYTNESEVLAEYHRQGSNKDRQALLPKPEQMGITWNESTVELLREVTLDGEKVGVIHLIADLKGLEQHFQTFSIICLITIVVSMMVFIPHCRSSTNVLFQIQL